MVGKKFRVLSLDGGGVRGIYTASLLQQLALRISRFTGNSAESGLDLGGRFDLIVGTSTGSIVAAALVAGVPLEEVVNLYRTRSSQIFHSPQPVQRGGCLDKLRVALWALRHGPTAANQPHALSEALRSVLQEETMEQVYLRRGIALCVPSVDATTNRAWVFKTPHHKRLTRDNRYRLVDVCLASAAAPIYFPIHGVKDPDGGGQNHWFVDGGLWANNPVLVGMVEALEIAPPDAEIEVLSVGTGGAPKSNLLTEAQANRGTFGWKGGVDIVSMSLESQATVTAYLAKQLAASTGRVTLHRLQDSPVAPEEAGYLGLDTGTEQAIAHMEKRASRSTDLNYSDLTTGADSAERRMTLDMFSNLKTASKRVL
ncbi:MAG: CBASS cGAMP-activated phospholipase [Methylophilaceae bacterium]|uniref:CBASS cGAMP-activated phospholipase n=1 Tax=Hydrogenophaga sp. TaxID=1904254 RepID=UPI0027312F38|nr:CBASS cGAMP-activated phospholipase [Hydrogenophaga sp.]MDP2249409.1 CBASS cGAMP-activated phospholipase [Hydrogenophaga sp.]MDZ4097631.1 CBASS cGAMP-activated phospholipase [Methylophilaceae bacterium]